MKDELPPLDGEDPLPLFATWFAEALAREPINPNAMALATADQGGAPNVRMVLLKEADPRGFVFYTNDDSAKGSELAGNPRAALCFYWSRLQRQIRVRGSIEKVASEEADAYFATRPKDARIGAWASRQSRPMEGRFELEREIARYAARYALSDVPRPPFWSGYRLVPLSVEFWRERLFRLHDRLLFERDDAHARGWRKSRLFP